MAVYNIYSVCIGIERFTINHLVLFCFDLTYKFPILRTRMQGSIEAQIAGSFVDFHYLLQFTEANKSIFKNSDTYKD